MSSTGARSDVELQVTNVGGITETVVELEPGITVLSGRNASNRTSLLQAIAAALGSDHASLKSDADAGEVRLELGGTTYTRRLSRENGTVVSTGTPYLDDAEVADLFAFLFSWNEARRAATGGEDLREVIMRPVDTERIQAEIRRLEERKDRLDDRLAKLDELSRELPDLEAERSRIRNRIEDTRTELEATRERLEAADGPERSTLEDRVDELTERRTDLEDVRFRLESERESVESLEDERSTLREQREGLPEVREDRIEDVDREIEHLRERKRSLGSTVTQLNRIVEFNEEVLDGDGPSLGDRESVTEELLDGGSVTCWTCGSEVRRGAIEETLDRLREVRRRHTEERSEVQRRLEELKDEREQLVDARQERERLSERLDRIDREIETRRSTIADLQEREADLEAEIADLEGTVDRLRSADDGATLDRQREVSELEFELDRLEGDLADVEDRIDEVERRLEERPEVEAERERVRSDLQERRTRIDRIETEAVEAFNEHMDSLLSALEYDNVDRVWIERTETDRREGRGTVTRRTFDLHVVRSGDGGVAYEDTVDHLSESERELVGLVFALAGYLAHEVYEEVPFMLLDSLEAIDGERIAALVDYFGEHTDYLVVALLPEDARAVDPDNEVTEI